MIEMLEVSQRYVKEKCLLVVLFGTIFQYHLLAEFLLLGCEVLDPSSTCEGSSQTLRLVLIAHRNAVILVHSVLGRHGCGSMFGMTLLAGARWIYFVARKMLFVRGMCVRT